MTKVHDAVTGALFTELRTAVAGVVAADLPAKLDARSAAVIGAGGQARYQLLALLKVRRVEQVTLWGRRQAAEQYQRDMATTGAPGKYVPDSIAAADSGELHHALGAGLLVAGSVYGELAAGVGAAALPHRGRRADRGRPGRPGRPDRPGHPRRSDALADEHGTGRDVPRGD